MVSVATNKIYVVNKTATGQCKSGLTRVKYWLILMGACMRHRSNAKRSIRNTAIIFTALKLTCKRYDFFSYLKIVRRICLHQFALTGYRFLSYTCPLSPSVLSLVTMIQYVKKLTAYVGTSTLEF